MSDTPTLTDEQREEMHQRLMASDGCYEGESCCLDSLDALAPLVARMVADAERRGRAEVSAAVGAVLSTLADASASGYYIVHKNADGSERGRSLDAYVVRPLRTALDNPAAAVARIKAEALREAADDWVPAGPIQYANTAAWLRDRANRIGGESDG